MSTTDFQKLNWHEIAEYLGARLIRQTEQEVEIALPHRMADEDCPERPHMRLLITDNGGELNVSKVVPALDESLPYTRGSQVVGPFTMAARLNLALLGRPIDWQADYD